MRKLNQILLTSLFFIIPLNAVYSQTTGSIRGFVYNKADGEAVAFHAVVLSGTPYGNATDANGYYILSRVKPGTYTLVAQGVGYKTFSMEITIEAGRIINRNILVEQEVQQIEQVKISAQRQERQTQVKMSNIKVSPKELEKLPTIGGEPDLAQYLQVIPGVIFTGDQGGQLYIRGGSPIQNKVLLDGMVVYNPFHSIGLFSVFDSDIIQLANIYTGGFNSRYGGRISSIMDITTRDGNKKRIGGKVAVSPFGAKLLVEGPIVKMKDDGEGGSASFILSGKTSYLEQSSKIFYNYIDTAGLPFNYNDFFGKISINSSNGSKISVNGYNYNDNVKYQAISDLQWNSFGVGSKVILIPEGYNALINADLSFSQYEITLSEEEQKPRFSKINNFNLGLSFLYYIGEYGKDELEYGVEVLGGETNFQYHNTVGRKIEIGPEFNSELGIFVTYKKTWGKMIIEPSLRLHGYFHKDYLSFEPRLGFKYNITDDFRVKFAGGLYSQDLVAGNSDRDVVNLFYAFLQGIELLPARFNGQDVKHKLQKSIHAIVGTEYDITNRMNLNVEGYIKDNTQLININRNQLYDDNSENSDKPEYLRKPFIIENGLAYGGDVTLTYDYKRLYLYFVYSLGFVTRFDGVIDYVPHFDRRHNVNLVGNYTFGEDLNWEAGVRWNLGSGFPFTQTKGFYEKLPFYDGINTNYRTANGELGIVYAGLNEGRLPYYHRLDLNIKRTFEIGNYASLQASFSLTNAYNRRNIFYFSRVTNEEIYQLPFIPSLGLSLKF